jgi:hypothetical protein
MKRDSSSATGDPLRNLLQEWKVTESLPPRFQEAVWDRIERAQPSESHTMSAWEFMVRWIETVLPRPALATVYVAVLLMVGVSAGWAQAEHKTARVKNELGERYLRVLDPYLAPRQ